MSTIKFNNPYANDKPIVIYPEECRVLSMIAKYYADKVESFKDDATRKEYRDWYVTHVTKHSEELQSMLYFLDFEDAIVENFLNLPAVIQGFDYAARYDDILNETGLLVLDTLCQRIKKHKARADKYSLMIPSTDHDAPSYKLTKPVIYEILNEQSVLRPVVYGYWYKWYPTLDELNVLLEKLDEILQNPLVSAYVFTLRKQVIKLIMRLKNDCED